MALSGMIEAGWIAALVIAPLYFNGYTSTVVEPDKLALIRAMASLMLAAWLVRGIDQRTLIPRRSVLRAPLVVPVLLVVLAYFFATIFSIAPRISWLGAYHRPQGLDALIAYVIVFALIRSDLRTRPQLDRLIVAMILTSFPVSLYAIFQKLGLDPMQWSEEFSGRVASTMGNPIFLGAYLALIFPLTLHQLIAHARAWWKNKPILPSALKVVGSLGITAAQAAALFATSSRGPWLGWFAGIVLFGILVALLLRQRRLVLSTFGLGAVLVAFLVTLNLPGTPLAPLRAIPGLDRLSNLSDPTSQFRLSTWENAARLIAPHPPIQFPDGAPDLFNVLRPILGYGPDTLALVYFQVTVPGLANTGLVTDHSHNETWDTLLTTGIAGLIASQVFYLSIFFYGLQWMGLLETARARKMFIALWIGLGGLGAIGVIILGQMKYLGLAAPFGNLAAILVCLLATARQKSTPSTMPVQSDHFLIAAVLAGFFAHYVESQFGIAVPATRLLEWTFAGMLLAVGWRKIEPALAPPAKSATPSYALIVCMICATILFGFLRFAREASDPLTLFGRALIFNPTQNEPTYTILVLLGATWIAACAITLSKTWRTDLIWLSGTTLATILLVGLGMAMQWISLSSINLPIARAEDAAPLIAGVTRIVDSYTLILFGWVGIYTAVLMFHARPHSAALGSTRWGLIVIAPVALIALVWINVLDFNPTRADVAYRLGKLFEDQDQWDAAIVGYQNALVLAPLNDAYLMALGRAFQTQSRTAEPTARAQFSGETRLDQILARDHARAPKLNRVDWLFAAQRMLLRARELNPLYPDHTLNLARFYAPDPPVNTEGKRKLADLSSDYYAQASRLIPNDPRLWIEWADFDLEYLENPDAALSKLREAARRDPESGATWVKIGDIHKTRSNLDAAIAAYQRALAVPQPAAQAASGLAFVYYQQNNFAEAIKMYQRFIELAPADDNVWEARKNLALIYKQTGDLRAAIQQAELARALAPNDAKAQLNELINQWRAQ
jgi:tetratricopeptide (TPR) repeat protein